MRKTALFRVIVAAAVGLVMTVAFAVPASAAPVKPAPSGPQPTGAPAGFASWAELFAVQNTLDAAASKITATKADGLAGVIVSPADRTVQVYWKGAVPAAVQKLAGDLGVTVRFQSARYTQGELVAEAIRLAGDPRVLSAAPKADGSGVAVTVASGARSVDQADLQALARIPLTVSVGEQAQAMFSRQADIPAFWGGSRYNSPVGGCSNGFALFVSGSANVFELSAGHCGSNGQGVSIPGQPNPTGSILAKSTNRDTLAINYPASVGAAIYNGPFNSSTGVHVGGATPDFVGDQVCTGGASSGEHCGITVQSVNVFTSIGGIPGVVGPLTFAAYPTATCAVAPGDSGGPVYSYSGSDVLGRGTVTAGQTGTAVCPGIVANGSRLVLYAPLVRPAGDPQIGSLQFYGVGILT